MAVTNISDRLSDFITEALGVVHEDVWWDCSMGMIQTGPNSIEAVYHIAVSIPAAQIGQRITAAMMLPFGEVTEDNVSHLVREAIEGMRSSRSQELASSGGGNGDVLSSQDILARLNGSPG